MSAAVFYHSGNPDLAFSAELKKITVTDMKGRSVLIPEPSDINRVAILTSPQVLAAYVIGVQDKLCAVTNSVKKWELLYKFDPHLHDVPAVRSQAAQVNIEALLQADPDIVIGSELDMQPVEKSTGLITLRINSSPVKGSINQTIEEIRFFGKVFDREDRAEIYISNINKNLSRIKEAVAGVPLEKRPKVFMGYDTDHLTTYGGGTFMDEWIEAAGCVNAAKGISSLGGKEGGLVSVSMEHILSWDPDIVIIDSGNPEDLLSDSSWSKLSAMKDKKVYRLPSGLFIWNRASCEAAAMLPQWLAIIAYPDKLGNLKLRDEVRRFYVEIFRFKLSDDDINNILYPSIGRR
jgi:iron complex transport system substrate-binding protein